MSTSLALACQLNSGSPIKSLPRRVRSILNKYGATMLLPGVSGAMRFGYQPGNYRESTGQTLAAADQQVGLVVDAARSPGPELVSNTGPFATTLGWGSARGGVLGVSSGRLTITGDGVTTFPAAYFGFDAVVGRSYQVTVAVGAATANTSVVVKTTKTYVGGTVSGATGVISASGGTLSFIFVATANAHSLGFENASASWSGAVISASVRELPGIHASQSTSGFQPVLRNTAGIQSWQFDGTDDRLSLSAVPFQMSDDHWVVAGGTNEKSSGIGVVFSLGDSASASSYYSLRLTSVTAVIRDSAASTVVHTESAGSISVGESAVAAFSCVSGSVKARKNSGAWTAPVNFSSIPVTLNSGGIGCLFRQNGAASADFHNGKIHGVIFGKGAIADAELLTLERFVASLQGRTL